MPQIYLIFCCLTLSAFATSDSITTSAFSFKLVRMCLKPEFLRSQSLTSPTKYICSSVCLARGSRCQGFRLRGSVCSTFEFDKCSHMVNDPACNNFEWVYVRKQEGLPHGQLCPDGYGNGYNGSVYKMISVTSWTKAMNICSSQPGLTKFADAFDTGEISYLHTIKATLNTDLALNMRSTYLGGHRIGPQTGGAWWWIACNATFQPGLWAPGQPSGADIYCRANLWYSDTQGLDTEVETASYMVRALCECLNPFA